MITLWLLDLARISASMIVFWIMTFSKIAFIIAIRIAALMDVMLHKTICVIIWSYPSQPSLWFMGRLLAVCVPIIWHRQSCCIGPPSSITLIKTLFNIEWLNSSSFLHTVPVEFAWMYSSRLKWMRQMMTNTSHILIPVLHQGHSSVRPSWTTLRHLRIVRLNAREMRMRQRS